jgi:hypothetical protein
MSHPWVLSKDRGYCHQASILKKCAKSAKSAKRGGDSLFAVTPTVVGAFEA